MNFINWCGAHKAELIAIASSFLSFAALVVSLLLKGQTKTRVLAVIEKLEELTKKDDPAGESTVVHTTQTVVVEEGKVTPATLPAKTTNGLTPPGERLTPVDPYAPYIGSNEDRSERN